MMKRRKTVSKYTVGDNGQIQSTSPRKLSNRTQQLMELMMFAQMFSALSDETSSIDEENVVDIVDETESSEITD